MQQLPQHIHVGMDVFDADNKHIGSVEDFRFGEGGAAGADSVAGHRDKSLIDNLAEAIWPDDMPQAQRTRLLQEGYVLLDADGILHSDRYVLAHQIASASNDRIVLGVKRDDLAKA